jgi:outer membrane protein OmpA-like peptidoglycan-associated protein
MLDDMKANDENQVLVMGGVLNIGFAKLGLGCLLAASTVCLPVGTARAQAMREVFELPADCEQLLAPQYRGGQESPWQSTVRTEHCDRMKRLRAASVRLPPDQRPRFYEGVVPASRLPSNFGTDLPVLRVVFPERTFFKTGSDRLLPEASQVARIVAESLSNDPPDVAMFVAGHADSRGSDAANEVLSQNRAKAVALNISESVRANKPTQFELRSIWRIGFGEDMPLHSGTTETDYAFNRRVEFLFAAKPEAVGIWLADQQFEELCQSKQETELAACREQLAFREGYDAEVVNPRGVARRDMPQAQAVSPTRVKPRGTRAVVRTPKNVGTVGITPAQQARSQVIPANVRKIRIDPVNPDSKPVTVIL